MLLPTLALAAPVTVTVEAAPDGGFALLRGGAPFAIRGGGYAGRLDALVAAGGNAIRTWGVGDDTAALLDEAHAADVAVVLGIWLAHTEHGFDYGDAGQVAEQLARARAEVERFRDHPALLMWGVGNEVELEGGDDPEIWRAIEQVAAMIHELDPHHPTMAVTAELGAANDARLRELCPSIDVWGINSYGGAPSLPERLTGRGFAGPYVVTELGPPGDWEVGRHPWGAPIEPSSTDKAAATARAWDVITADPRALGAFAFLWGPAQHPLDTWFPLFGPGELRFGTVDVLHERWRGEPPADRAPVVTRLEGPDGATVAPGSPITARLDASDPEGAALRYAWVLHRDRQLDHREGRWEKTSGPPLTCAEGPTFDGTAPDAPGPYRLLGVARDPADGAAYASARFLVDGEAEEGWPLPFWVDDAFAPSGWMGDVEGLSTEPCPPPDGSLCHGGCTRIAFSPRNEGWAGIVWQHPANDWEGEGPGVRVVDGRASVRFVAWGAEGGEVVRFFVGLKGPDRFEVSREIVLDDEPRTYTIDVPRRRHRDVTAGFGFSLSAPWGQQVQLSVADARWIVRGTGTR